MVIRIRPVLAVAAVAGVLAVAGCAADQPERAARPPASTGTTSATPTGSAPAASSPAATAGPVVPERLAFTAKTVDGTDFDAATLAGRPVVLWFWAPWCVKCRADARSVAATAGQYAGRVTVVGVAGLSTDVGSMRDFVTGTKTGGLTHLADPAGGVWKRFGVTVQDSYVLLAADGSVVHTGVLTTTELAARVAKLAG